MALSEQDVMQTLQLQFVFVWGTVWIKTHVGETHCDMPNSGPWPSGVLDINLGTWTGLIYGISTYKMAVAKLLQKLGYMMCSMYVT